ncbi:allantoate deiminase 2, partial [Tanacetum coccineum]
VLPIIAGKQESKVGDVYRAHSLITIFNRNNIQQTTIRICSVGKMYMTTQVITVHIEQRPALESMDLALTVVKAISGQTRIKLTVRGYQGHATTVPMSTRQYRMAMIF